MVGQGGDLDRAWVDQVHGEVREDSGRVRGSLVDGDISEK